MVGDTDTRRIGMATSYPNTSDTVFFREEMFETFDSGSCDYIACENRLIMNELIHQNLLLLYSSMGAVLGRDGDGFLFVKYWKRKNVLNKCSQVIMRKPIIYMSGF